ncbi:helix-turn-helix domain-containing protein [Streptomyces sp. NPDC087525]|uniref:helix-turn-helix domain-containing protein n=1 Tax=Streptomyces sp. NPDC087525 TaxID=3365793 RepID=UPI0038115131
MLPDSSRLLTVREVAAALRVSIPTVYRWIANDEMRAIRYGKPRAIGDAKRGGAIRIPESEVDVRLSLEPSEAA